MFSNLIYILVKMDVRFYDYAIYSHGQKTVFEWCAHFQSSGITEHNHNWWAGHLEEMDIIFYFLLGQKSRLQTVVYRV